MEEEYTNRYGEETTSPLEASMFNLEVIRLAGEVDEDICCNAAAIQEKKKETKQKCINVCSNATLLSIILNDQKDWPTLAEAEEKQKIRSETLTKCKSEVEGTKETINSLCETAENAYLLLKSRYQEVQKNLSLLESKKKILNELKNKQAESNLTKKNHNLQAEENKQQALAVKEQIEEAIEKNKLHISYLQTAIQRVESRMEIVSSLNMETDEPTCSLELQRLKALISTHEKLGRVKAENISSDKLKLEIENDSLTEEQPRLEVILTFDLGFLSTACLKDVQLNIPSLDVTDIVEESINNNDVISLVRKLKERWLSHLPLLSEINRLQKTYAIDWIQEEGLLRLMAGRGCVVCTLSIPPTYPVHNHITLQDIKGCDLQASQIQENTRCKTLEDWAKYLVSTFGNP